MWEKGFKEEELAIVKINRENHNTVVALLDVAHSLLPNEYRRLQFDKWLSECRNAGLINNAEKQKAMQFCLNSLYF